MSYTFAILKYDDGWKVEDYVTGNTHTTKETKAATINIIENELFRGNTGWLGAEVSEPIGCLTYKKTGGLQDFIVNDDRFLELIHAKMGAGGNGTYHIHRVDGDWAVRFVPEGSWLTGEGTNIISRFPHKSDARGHADELLWDEAAAIASVYWDWYGEKVTGFTTPAFIWDFFYSNGYSL